MNTDHYPNAAFLRFLANQAGDIMRHFFVATSNSTEWKADGTPVTTADVTINKMVIAEVAKTYPHVNVEGEEDFRRVNGAAYVVLVDPIDGTIPFGMGLPLSAFCISVTHYEKGVLAAVIYDPFLDRMWWAEKGVGAFSNQGTDPLRVSQHKGLTRARLCVPYWDQADYRLECVTSGLSAAGAFCVQPLAIAYFGGLIASGLMEGCIFPGNEPWETSAMQLIVEEAGGRATDIYGQPLDTSGARGRLKGHIISNGLIHDDLIQMVQRHQ